MGWTLILYETCWNNKMLKCTTNTGKEWSGSSDITILGDRQKLNFMNTSCL